MMAETSMERLMEAIGRLEAKVDALANYGTDSSRRLEALELRVRTLEHNWEGASGQYRMLVALASIGGVSGLAQLIAWIASQGAHAGGV